MSEKNTNEELKEEKVSEKLSASDSLESEILSDSLTLNNGKKFYVSKIDGSASNLYDWIRSILFAIVIVIFVLTFFFRLVDVKGTSMVETLQNNDKVIVTNFMYTPQDGDIVVISHGAEYSEPIIKRVIATEGETLQLDYENDYIIVNGIVLKEDYLDGDSTFSGNFANYEIPTVIPEGKIFVMGDNRDVSMDSRNSKIGLIDVDSVIGKAEFVAFPFADFTYLY